MLVNVDGEAFMHPLETRDVSAASIIRECSDDRNEGVETRQGKAVWLDTPMIDLLHGEGTIEKRIPAMFRMFMQYGIDMRKEPISGLSDPALSERRSGNQRRRLHQYGKQPACSRRGCRRNPRKKPSDG